MGSLLPRVIGLLVLAGLVVGGLATASGSDTARTDPQYYRVKLVNVTAEYLQERWKDNPGFYGSDPAGGLANASGQYDQAVGYRVTLKVKLTDETGKDVDPSDPELPFVNLTAYVDTGRGRLNAFVEREGAAPVGPFVPLSSGSPVFYLRFDADGTDFSIPPNPSAGQPVVAPPQPALSSGLQFVHVEVTRGTTGNKVTAGEQTLVFSYALPSQQVSVAELSGAHVTDVPDTMFRLFNDIGYGSSVRMIDQDVDPSYTLNVDYQFPGASGATVRWWALAAERLCQPPACTPGGPGTVEVHRKLLDAKAADAQGMVHFSSKADDLRRFAAKTYDAAIVVVVADLEPQADIASPFPDDLASGGGRIRTGATELVVPISRASLRISGFAVNTSAAQSNAPDAAYGVLVQANALEVDLYDDSGNTRDGDAIAFKPDAPGSKEFGRGSFSPPKEAAGDPVLALKYRAAQIPVRGIQAAHVSSYRVMAIMYSTPQDFYGLTYADRGYTATLSAPVAKAPGKATVWVNLTSVTTNYDLRTLEPGFDLKVLGHVVIPDLQANLTEDFALREGGQENRPVTVGAERASDVRITFTSTTGDTLPDPLAINARFVDAGAHKGFIDRIPGFEGIALVFVLAGLATLRGSRRA